MIRDRPDKADRTSRADVAPDAPDLAGWMRQYGPGLRRFLARRVDDADVDDLVQDVFVRMQTAQPSQPIEHADRYLFRVAQNVLISRYRATGGTTRPTLVSLETATEPRDDMSPERIAIGREQYARVVQAIAALPPRVRAAFVLHRFENMTYQTIATRMGISKNSVKELIHRGLVRLSDVMDDVS
jgi:RNA polymerase sigma factor (sigma-70 family)|uniref:RNA polymerase sigma factor n=1 Tax=uncultured Sphingomonas sp. TaxID=158754 RepID=UPI0035C9B785